jgi:subtilase family serine protease
MSLHRSFRHALIAFCTALIALLGVLIIASPSGATPSASPVPLATSRAPRLPAGAARLGALSPGTKLTLEVTLNIPDQAALNAFLAGVANPESPYYEQFLKPGQFGPRFGPSLAQIAQVENALRSAGLSPGQVSANRLSIPVTATVSAIDHAFGIAIDSYRLPGGREAYANTAAPTVPAAVAPLVDGVLGLDDLYLQQHTTISPGQLPVQRLRTTTIRGASGASPSTTGPQACAAASDSGNTATTIAGYYGTSLLYLNGDLGQNTRVGVLELEPNLPSDITAYEQCYGISTKVNYLSVDGGVGTGAGQGEAALDIEMVAGLAPDTTIDVYQAPNTGTGVYDDYQKFATSDTDKTLSVSWGNCEANLPVSFMDSEETVYEQANAQGQSIFAAAGDNGSTGCNNDTTANDTVSAGSPADAPYVIGVGGTSFNSAGQEVVWNESGLGLGAGGGGVSTVWCMPAYQHQTSIPNVINSDSKKDTSSSCASKYYREEPDISANADPVYGYAVYYDGGWVLGGIGGTSAAAPVLASIATLTDASPFCSAYGSKGPALPQNLYNVAAAYHSYIYASAPEGIRDITSGNNDYTDSGYPGGLYPATTGYDMASGLGAPMVSGLSGNTWYYFIPGLTTLLCHQSATKLKTVSVSSVSPSAGVAGKSVKVTVHGAGFLPLQYADEAEILSGSKVLATVAATCSTTACTVTLPAESARTVDIKIYAESLWSSATVAADRYTYAAAPHLSSASPTKGTPKGGTKITIHGTNFIGVSSVKFGSKAGTKVQIVSSTEIIVVTPAGSKGTVKLTVTAAGGTSKALTYQYT